MVSLQQAKADKAELERLRAKEATEKAAKQAQRQALSVAPTSQGRNQMQSPKIDMFGDELSKEQIKDQSTSKKEKRKKDKSSSKNPKVSSGGDSSVEKSSSKKPAEVENSQGNQGVTDIQAGVFNPVQLQLMQQFMMNYAQQNMGVPKA